MSYDFLVSFFEISIKNYIESWGQTFGTPDFDLWVRSVPASGSNVPGAPRGSQGLLGIRGIRGWGLRTQRPAQTGPGCQNLAFQRFEPIIMHDFSRRFRKTTLKKHSSKQMTVYEQITFFIKNHFFSKKCLTSEPIC